MIGLTRARRLRLAAMAALCLALVLPALAVAAATPTYTNESQQAYESQLQKGEIASATFNKRLRSLRLTLKDGSYFLYHYAKHESPKLKSALEAKHVPVTVLGATAAAKEIKKPGHKLRYIVGGVLILVIVIVGVVLLVNRRRVREDE